MISLLLIACQDYNLKGPGEDQPGKYNPPELASTVQNDRITQVTVPAVDVLWVIDNSCSMEEEQFALRSNFDSFMTYFTGSGLDYHVGVVSTDMDNGREAGRLIKDTSRGSSYIDASVDAATAIESFGERAALGTLGSSDERGKDAAQAALSDHADTFNAGFLREEATLSVIVISDERDYSRVSVNEFVNWYKYLKPEQDMLSFNSIVGPAPRGCATAEKGTGYLEVTNQIGGIEWSICTDDWGGLLSELGLHAAGLKREFFLSLVPVDGTIEVLVESRDGSQTRTFDTSEWTYSRARNSVTFVEYTPDPLSVVSVTYEILASAQDPGVEDTGDTGAE